MVFHISIWEGAWSIVWGALAHQTPSWRRNWSAREPQCNSVLQNVIETHASGPFALNDLSQVELQRQGCGFLTMVSRARMGLGRNEILYHSSK